MSRAVAPSKRPSRSRTAKAFPKAASKSSSPARYLDASQTPLTALLFVLPLLVLHEVGVRWYGTIAATGTEYRITAFTLIARFLHSVGASGRYLPALIVVAVLVSIHVAHRQRWMFNISLLPLMVAESIAWALPLVGVYFLFAPNGPILMPGGNWKLMASLYLGAGVYEEFVFRLSLFALLSFIWMDVLRMSARVATPLIVVIAAITFSAYHMWGIRELPWQAFVFIGLRGLFYGIIFLERGFGVTVGVHTAYDLLIIFLGEANGGWPKLFSTHQLVVSL
jgi:hypothetical protein